jgi:hypothetical protein
VLTTWTTSDVWTNVWKDSQKSVSIGMTARAFGAGELSPKIEWSNAQSGGGWIHPIPTMKVNQIVLFDRFKNHMTNKMRKNGKTDERVVFFRGVRLKLYKLPFGVSAPLHPARERIFR